MSKAAALALLFFAPFARGASLTEAQDNADTIVRTYVGYESPEGFWPVKQKGGKTLHLKLTSVEKETAQRTSSTGEQFMVGATFNDELTGKPYYADIFIDMSGTEWRVVRVAWTTKKIREKLAREAREKAEKEKARAATLTAAAEMARKARATKRASYPVGTPALPQLALVAVGSMEPVSLDACPTPKCLTVYVAPWCPHCRNATANILTLRKYLEEKGIATRVIVGNDSEREVEQYAESFGKGVLLDADKQFKFSGGVPHLFVSEDGGKILKDMAGFYEDPMPGDQLAAALDLP